MNRPPVMIRPQPLQRRRQWCRDEIPLLSMTLSLPRCGAALPDGRARRMDRYYESFQRSCEQYAERFLLPEAADAFDAALAQQRLPRECCYRAEFTTTLLSDTVWSLTLETREETVSQPFCRRFSDTWDLRSGYPLALAELFPGEPLYRRRLRLHARKALQQAQGLRENWRAYLVSAWNSERFYLSPAGLHWYYPMYALGGAELGIPTFFLPWEEGQNPRLPPGLTLDKSEGADLS